MTIYSGKVNKFNTPHNMQRSSLCFCWVMRLIAKEDDLTNNVHCVYPACVWNQKKFGVFILELWTLYFQKHFQYPAFQCTQCPLSNTSMGNEPSSLARGVTLHKLRECPGICQPAKEIKAQWLEQHRDKNKFDFQLGVLRKCNSMTSTKV